MKQSVLNWELITMAECFRNYRLRQNITETNKSQHVSWQTDKSMLCGNICPNLPDLWSQSKLRGQHHTERTSDQTLSGGPTHPTGGHRVQGLGLSCPTTHGQLRLTARSPAGVALDSEHWPSGLSNGGETEFSCRLQLLFAWFRLPGPALPPGAPAAPIRTQVSTQSWIDRGT